MSATASDISSKGSDRNEARIWLYAVCALAVFTPLSFFFLDRAVSRFSYDNLRVYRKFFDALTHIVDPFSTIGALAIVAAIVQHVRGRRVGPTLETLARAGVGLCVTIVTKDLLKYAFGRTWPETWTNNNPSFIGNGTYGFFPFHGGQGWYAFPSGHTAAVCAVAAALWVLWPRGRPLYALAVALVAFGLLGANYHWVTDITVGGALGTAIGITAARVGRRQSA